MNLQVIRKTRSLKTTTGQLFIENKFFCYTLEDVDRGLTHDMPLEEISEKKVHGQTAIPTGTYNVVAYYSPKHGGNVPLLQNVPGFDYVEIHAGNKAEDTDGCLLLGYDIGVDVVARSRDAVRDFYEKFFDAIDNNETVTITYQ